MPVQLVDVVHIRLKHLFPSRSIVPIPAIQTESATGQPLGQDLGPHAMYHTAQVRTTLETLGYGLCSHGRLNRLNERDWMSLTWRLDHSQPRWSDQQWRKPFGGWIERSLTRYWRKIGASLYDSPDYGRILTVSLDEPVTKSIVNRRGPEELPIAGWCIVPAVSLKRRRRLVAV